MRPGTVAISRTSRRLISWPVVLVTALVLTVAVAPAAAAFTTPQRITNNDKVDNDAHIAVDSNGCSHVVWREEVSLNDSKVFYADNTGGSWEPVQISSGGDTDREPKIVVDSNNVSHVIWIDGNSYDIYYRNNQGGTWGATTDVSQDIAGNNFDLNIAVDSGDNVHVAWYDPDGIIYYRKRTAAGTWVDFFWIDPVGSTINEKPKLAVDPAGHPHIIWCSLLGDWCVYYWTYDGAHHLAQVSNFDEGEVIDSGYEIVVDSNRKAHVAYSQHDVGESSDVFYANNAAGGDFSSTNISDSSTTDDYRATIGVDSNNKVHIAWVKASPLWDLYYTDNTSGSFSTPIIISDSSDTISKLKPQLEMDSTNVVHVTWHERYTVGSDSGSTYVDITYTYEAKYTNNCGGSFVGVTDLGGGVLKGYNPDMAIDSNDNAHIAFTVLTGSGDIYKEIFYTMGGGPIGGGTTWYLAEGSTGGTFETWVLVQNPNDTEATVTLTYMTGSGEIAGPSETVPANSRKTFNVANHAPGQDSVSTKV
ncbi:MAG: hypothetical protein KJ602_03280, partial [Actinobacteria bacterium]|nr:hypothetical protein [Actinomycetota bacterium]